MNIKTGILAVAVLSLAGCATKGYQIAAPLSDNVADSMTCRELNLELAEVDEISLAIKKEAKTDIRSVGAFLMDFGIGNSMAKNRAEEALAERRASITGALISKNCAMPPAPVAKKALDEKKKETDDSGS